MRILGIDPGLRLTGFGCVQGDPLRPQLVEAGVIRLVTGSGPTPDVGSRLVELERDLIDLLDRVRPDLVAVERLFSHHRFPGTGVLMGHARGVILCRLAARGLPLVEIEPAAVKKALTGAGGATKRQMQLGIQAVFNLAEPPSPPDVADALAIAITAGRRTLTGGAAGVIAPSPPATGGSARPSP